MCRPTTDQEMMRIGDPTGKGTLGCLFSLVLLAVTIFSASRIGPPYFAYRSLESDVKTEVSRAGAHFYENETIIKNVLALAQKNEVSITQDDIKVERFAGQIQVTVMYSVPIDLAVYEYNQVYEIKASTFIGRL